MNSELNNLENENRKLNWCPVCNLVTLYERQPDPMWVDGEGYNIFVCRDCKPAPGQPAISIAHTIR